MSANEMQSTGRLLVERDSSTGECILLVKDVGGVSSMGVNVDDYGAVGDGDTDDTEALQLAFTYASTHGLVCVLTPGKRYKATAALYLWGEGSVLSWDDSGVEPGAIEWTAGSVVNLFNIGISGVLQPQQVWSGKIRNIKMKVVSASGLGRIIFFWRVNGGEVSGTITDVGANNYSLTSSGNNANILSGADCIRKNVTITRNKFTATASVSGSEGIGLGSWDGAVIAYNEVLGVGDDVIGIHYSRDISIHDNILTSTHGRLYVSNSVKVRIHDNFHTRIPRADNGAWTAGIALLYVGHETNQTSAYNAPTDHILANNQLVYPDGAVDAGGTISVYGGRTVSIIGNTIINNSATVTAAGILMVPFPYVGTWTDPSGMDTTTARVRDHFVSGNMVGGVYPQKIIQTSGATGFLGQMTVANNYAAGYSFYTDNRLVGNNYSGQPVVVTYSASMTFDASMGSGEFIIPVTNGTAFTINNPVNGTGGNQYPKGAKLVVTFVNTSGGAMGAITWGNNFKLAAFTGPATAKNQSITFTNASVYGSANVWREVSRTSADVPN